MKTFEIVANSMGNGESGPEDLDPLTFVTSTKA